MQLPENVKKYLSKHAEPNWSVKAKNNSLYDNIIVIPAIAELENIKTLLRSLSYNSKKHLRKTLLLFVINNTARHNKAIKEENLNTIKYLHTGISKNEKTNIAFIDASTQSKELPEKNGGVGYARKIGMDLALKFFDYKNSNKKILINLDADCTVSKNYLETIVENFNKRNISAAYVCFEHPLPQNPDKQRAIINYEIFLRYYILGLKYANSPYAFFTVGSTIVCDYTTYIKTGGMNKMKAAEDFYFLEKLSKVTEVFKLSNATVYPSPRTSWRTPFGTGQKVKQLLSTEQKESLIYSPEIFTILKKWFAIFYGNQNYPATEYLQKAEKINLSLKEFLIKNNFTNAWNKITNNSKSKVQISKQKKFWMDGFRTLKLIHYLRDNGFPNINTFKALNILFQKTGNEKYIQTNSTIPSLEIQKKYLKAIRNLTKV